MEEGQGGEFFSEYSVEAAELMESADKNQREKGSKMISLIAHDESHTLQKQFAKEKLEDYLQIRASHDLQYLSCQAQK